MKIKKLDVVKNIKMPLNLIPQRSQLYHLLPIGLGSNYAESLTSYIHRLADQHCVTSQTLIKKLIIPKMGKKYLQYSRKFLSKDSRTINGVTQYAHQIAKVLGDLTLKQKLEANTMIPWASIIDPAGKGLLKVKRAWCPACFQEWRGSGKIIYEPLLWSIRIITKCAIHEIPLASSCSYCKRKQPELLSRNGVGFCYYCDRWLGINKDNEDLVKARKKSRGLMKAKWLEDTVGEMIAVAPDMERYPATHDFVAALNGYCTQVANGNVASLARDIGLTSGTMRQWTNGRFRPRFDSLIDLCFRLKVTPVGLLSGSFENITESDLTPKAPYIRRHIKKSKISDIDKKKVKEALKKNLEKDSPLSIAKLAKGLKIKPGKLRYHFPDECVKVAEKRRIKRREKYAAKHS